MSIIFLVEVFDFFSAFLALYIKDIIHIYTYAQKHLDEYITVLYLHYCLYRFGRKGHSELWSTNPASLHAYAMAFKKPQSTMPEAFWRVKDPTRHKLTGERGLSEWFCVCIYIQLFILNLFISTEKCYSDHIDIRYLDLYNYVNF